MTVNQALMVEVGDETYAVPLANVEAVLRLSHEQMQTLLSTDEPYFEQAGFRYRFGHLGSILGASQPDLKRAKNRYPVILVRAGQNRMALLVESLLGRQEVVVKSVGPQLSALRWINGATILGDGSVVLILDVPSLVRAGMTLQSLVNDPEPAKSENANNTPVIMVVDDSITVRKVAGRFLSRNGMQVITAKDGVEALTLLQEQLPDLMLLDIEMPRMDGFELATTIRNSPRLKGLPIIMITSRTGKKHTDRANEIGVDRYLGKPYHEGELLENINELLGRAV
jgi:chemosensory pili system protein ChpA (sensor histidine kinase/response regulator)